MSFNEIMKLIWQITITLGFILNSKMIRDLYELHRNEKFKNDLREQCSNIKIQQLHGEIEKLKNKRSEEK